MILSTQAKEVLRNAVEQKPLCAGEIRKVQGLGGLYVTLDKLPSEDEEGEIHLNGTVYWYQYSLILTPGDAPYYFYGGAPYSS
jgi:hypothetical protein